MRILYLGNRHPHATCTHRAEALRRLGHAVAHLDPQDFLPSSRWVNSLNIRTGYRLFETRICRRLLKAIGTQAFDAVWVAAGTQIGPGFYRAWQQRGVPIINYNHDDAFCTHQFRKWDLHLRALKYFDLAVVVRKENISEVRCAGAKKVARVFMSYDPVAHAPLSLAVADKQRLESEVLFVGSWKPERGPFLARLIQLRVPLSIWGDRWQKAAEWDQLRVAVRGQGLYGPDYVKALQCSNVALGLLSVENRDLHTTRSAEIPFIGGACFCAQRTADHLEMYQEGEEALFWSSADECAAQCHQALASSSLRERLSAGARRRVIQMGLSNDETLTWILEALSAEASQTERFLPQH